MLVECHIECYNKNEVENLGMEEKTFWSKATFNMTLVIAIKEYMEDEQVDESKSVLFTANGDFIVDLPYKEGVKILNKMYA